MAPMIRILSLLETRALGVLMEKERTVPDSYPLTLNAIVSGCNQKTSRDPIVNRYQPGGRGPISNVPAALTVPILDPDPKLPNAWNSLTLMPPAGGPDGLVTDPEIRAPRTATSSIRIGGAP